MSLPHDIRQAVRLLYKAPWFTAASVCVLGLGIGTATAIFSLVDALLRPLPYRDAHRLVMLSGRSPIAPLILTIVALLACPAPAIRALRADPIAALRAE